MNLGVWAHDCSPFLSCHNLILMRENKEGDYKEELFSMQKCIKVAKNSEENIRKVCKIFFFWCFFLCFQKSFHCRLCAKLSFTWRTIVPYDVLLCALVFFFQPFMTKGMMEKRWSLGRFVYMVFYLYLWTFCRLVWSVNTLKVRNILYLMVARQIMIWSFNQSIIWCN